MMEWIEKKKTKLGSASPRRSHKQQTESILQDIDGPSGGNGIRRGATAPGRIHGVVESEISFAGVDLTHIHVWFQVAGTKHDGAALVAEVLHDAAAAAV